MNRSFPRRWRLLLWAGAAGIAGVSWLPSLPAFLWTPVFFLPLLGWRRAGTPARVLIVALLGAGWGLLSAHWQLAHRLLEAWQDTELRVRGTLVGLPDRDPRRERVLLAVESVATTEGRPLRLPLRRVQVSWYGGPPLHGGERWQFRLKVKQPRGFVNPEGFDYQLWLMRQQVDATAYVRPGADNRRLEPAGPGSLSHWRERARQRLERNESIAHPALLRALLVGDRSGLSAEQWERLTQTGTNHLLAISGLHVGFVALMGFGLGSGLGRLLNLMGRRWPDAVAGHGLAFVFALGYSALAGFSIPTQRALIMVLVLQGAMLCRRRVRPADGLSLALLAVLVRDPLAPFDAGFWLSFAAVAVLLLAFSGRRRSAGPMSQLVTAQWVVFVGLLVPLLALTREASLLSPLANALAIPLVTFMVVPWLLAAVVLAPILPTVGQGSLWLADLGLSWLVAWLDTLRALWPEASLSAVMTPLALLLTLLGAQVWLLPRGLPLRWLGLTAMLLALSLPGPKRPPLRLAMLDVGQGLAIVVQTPDHTLVYDTGPRYSDRMDAGSAIIAPYLRRLGVERLDAVVLSHGHDDHAGGYAGLTREMGIETLWAGEPGRHRGIPARSCHGEAAWRWNRVSFRFLHAGLPANANGNNRSCVLLIEFLGRQLLLTGDIEREVEWRLVGRERVPEALTLLQVPHHGAKTSSTPVWVERTRPELALVSASFQGRHGHPSEAVVARYQARGSRVLNTATRGALIIEWDRQGRRREYLARVHDRRWWFATP